MKLWQIVRQTEKYCIYTLTEYLEDGTEKILEIVPLLFVEGTDNK